MAIIGSGTGNGEKVERTYDFIYCAEDLTTGEVICCDDSLVPIMARIRKDIKAPHGNKVRTEIIEHGICLINGYGKKHPDTYYSWAVYVERW